MPYILPEDRKRLTMSLTAIPNTAGELNYLFTMLSKLYFEKNGNNYQAINDVIGALEGCKLEFYRRLVSPYEDKKIESNGDCY